MPGWFGFPEMLNRLEYPMMMMRKRMKTVMMMMMVMVMMTKTVTLMKTAFCGIDEFVMVVPVSPVVHLRLTLMMTVMMMTMMTP